MDVQFINIKLSYSKIIFHKIPKGHDCIDIPKNHLGLCPNHLIGIQLLKLHFRSQYERLESEYCEDLAQDLAKLALFTMLTIISYYNLPLINQPVKFPSSALLHPRNWQSKLAECWLILLYLSQIKPLLPLMMDINAPLTVLSSSVLFIKLGSSIFRTESTPRWSR